MSPFVSKDIIVDVRDIHSVIQLHEDNLGEDDVEGNVLDVKKFIDADSGEVFEQKISLSLPGDAYRDKVYMDWLISEKGQNEGLVDEY